VILLETLLAMSPPVFERLAQRLLRESGYSGVVTPHGRRRH
jgi:restriction endonuclease Mrr